MDFYFAKLNYNKTLFYTGKEADLIDVVVKALNNSGTIHFRSSPFTFADVEIIEHKGVQMIIGKLVKYRDEEDTTMDVPNQKTKSQTVLDKVFAQSNFIIEFKENILLYNENKNIAKASFIDRFNQLITKGLINYNLAYECEAIPIHDNYSFYESLQKLKTVFYLELTIHPTNPYPIDLIQDIDKKLNTQNVSQKKTKYKAKKGGLNINDEEIKNNSIYTDVGYGIGKAMGETKSGKQITISSTKSERQKKANIDEFNSMRPFEIIDQINKLIDEKN
ncbi:hypothetical protein [Spirosoma agri]|uniref:DUF4747 family protein n=1 Tax=Spirosoma agri TaxID=1987381 RepID=A0A6M0IE12_9BACT|nr:hypothetical protein [Spirosoma agri]NEU65952.1 hypothetical protein [Spirosoma agri]